MSRPDERSTTSGRHAPLSIEPRAAWSVDPSRIGRAENLSFSRCGAFLVVVDAGSERVLVYERKGATYSDAPVWSLAGREYGLDYPHDADVSPDGRWLVVANRRGRSITGYRREDGPVPGFSARPAWILRGRKCGLGYCDGVRFVPPDGAVLGAVNLAENRVTFFRRRLFGRGYGRRPWYVLEGARHGLAQPDGLAFSDDGALLAVTNHGAGTVAVYARNGSDGRYGPQPAAVIGQASPFRCPHSVAFSPDGTHLAVTNAGGHVVSIHRRESFNGDASAWTARPVLEIDAVAPDTHVSAQEGGPKGVAFGHGCFAFCSPEVGVRVHGLA